MEPISLSGSDGTGRFVWFVSQTVNSIGLIPIQPIAGRIDWIETVTDRRSNRLDQVGF